MNAPTNNEVWLPESLLARMNHRPDPHGDLWRTLVDTQKPVDPWKRKPNGHLKCPSPNHRWMARAVWAYAEPDTAKTHWEQALDHELRTGPFHSNETFSNTYAHWTNASVMSVLGELGPAVDLAARQFLAKATILDALTAAPHYDNASHLNNQHQPWYNGWSLSSAGFRSTPMHFSVYERASVFSTLVGIGYKFKSSKNDSRETWVHQVARMKRAEQILPPSLQRLCRFFVGGNRKLATDLLTALGSVILAGAHDMYYWPNGELLVIHGANVNQNTGDTKASLWNPGEAEWSHLWCFDSARERSDIEEGWCIVDLQHGRVTGFSEVERSLDIPRELPELRVSISDRTNLQWGNGPIQTLAHIGG